MNGQYEILAPCGSPAALKAALAAGCDSVYLGAKAHNARAGAENFDIDELKSAIDACHLLGVKVYVTFNTLCKDRETEELFELAKVVYELGADGFITADIGILTAFKKYFKGININASTQMCICSSDGALALKALGADRIILSRELSLSDIEAVHNAVGETPDLEVFVHGALCVSYSGRCLFSSFIGGRSGNRGRCAQPCRMEYTLLKNGKPQVTSALLSPKDIMCAENLNKLIKAGVKAFKIEGRLKGAPYVSQTVKTYRKYLDRALREKSDTKISDNDRKCLLQVFSRGGSFSEGFLTAEKGRELLSSSVKNSGREIGVVTGEAKGGCYISFFESLVPGDGIEIAEENKGLWVSKPVSAGQRVFLPVKSKKGAKVSLSYDKRLNDSLKKEAEAPRQREITARFTARLGEASRLRLKAGEAEITLCGDAPEKAQSRPLTEEEITSRLKKTGATPFKITEITTDLSDEIYMPVKALNTLRRAACEALEENIKASYRRGAPPKPLKPILAANTKTPFLSAQIETEAQLKALEGAPVKRIYIGCFKLIEAALEQFSKNTEIYFVLPHIMRQHSLKRLKPITDRLEQMPVSGFLTRSLTTLKTDKKIICDHTLGVFNTYTAAELLKLYDGITLSTELSAAELKPLCAEGTEVIAYGRLPLMVTEHCPIGNFLGGNKGKRFCSLKNSPDDFALKDRTGAYLPLMPRCQDCFCEILSPLPLSAAPELKPASFRLIFTTETGDETLKITEGFYEALIKKSAHAQLPKGKPLRSID